MKKIDMSSVAITRRLRQTEQLRKLSLSLMKAKPTTDKDAAGLRLGSKTPRLDDGRRDKNVPEK